VTATMSWNEYRTDPNGQLLAWRAILGAFLTLTGVLMRALASDHMGGAGLTLTLGILYLSIALTWVALMYRVPTRPLLAAQLGSDLLVLALLVHFSGGPYSAFPVLFCVPIMLGAVYLGARSALILAGVASAVIGGGHLGLAVGWAAAGAPAELDYGSGRPVLITFLHVSLFLAVGVASGQLARSLAKRRRIHEQAAQQIQRTRNEVRNILDHLSSGLITIDRQGSVTRANPPACEILGMSASDLVGRLLAPAVGTDRCELAECVLQVAAGGPTVNRGEITIKRADCEVPLGITVNYLEDEENEVAGAVAIFTDLTEVRRMQESIRKAERLAGLGQLAASIAHEIRNPLGSIRGSVEILASELELVGHQAQLFDLVLKESGRINTIINDFLTFSRMRSPAPRRVECDQFLTEVALQIRQHVTNHGGSVILEHEAESTDLAVSADPEQLVQVILNLALNACEAMQYAGRLTIDARTSDNGRWCEFRVTDTGPGIDAETSEEVFTPFFTTKTGGTGLGLPMVARIVDSHGGTVEIDNAPDGGARFTVRLPLAAAETMAETPGIDAMIDEALAPATEQTQPV